MPAARFKLREEVPKVVLISKTVHFKTLREERVHKRGGLFLLVKAAAQLGMHLHAAIGRKELRRDAEKTLAYKILYFLFSFHNEPHGNALHASGTQGRFDFGPQDGADFIAHNAVQHPACLLGIHQVHVYGAGILNGVQNGLLSNLVEDDALCCGGVQFQGLLQVPGYGLSFAVLIRRQPYRLGLLHSLLQIRHQLVLLVRDLVLRLVVVCYVDAHLLF